MKKIISLLLLVLSGVIFYWYSSYTRQWPFDYHVAQFVGYLLYWSVALFVVSLFAFMLDNKKYKIWLLVTVVYVALSILFSYETGDGNNAIVSFDGKDLTWIFTSLYSLISIIYFIVQFFKNRKQSTLVK